jgi:DNA polymerase III subunit gamma/tau
VTYDLATGLLGFTPDALLDEVVDAFAAGDGATVFGVVDKVIETGQDPRRFTEDLLRRLRDLVIIAAVPDAPATGLIDVPQDEGERLTAQAARFGRSELSRAAELVADGLTELKGATAPRLLLELICARVLLPGADHDTDGLMARLDRIEKRMSIEGTPSVAQVPPLTRRPAAEPMHQPTPEPAPAPAPTQKEPSRPAPDPVVCPAEVPPEPVARPRPEAAPRAPEPETAQAEPEPSRSAPAASSLSLVDVRRLWPDLLDAVKLKRRYTWILLSQHAQVAAVDDKTLTIALVNAGARNSFSSGGSEEVLRQAAIDVIGHDWRIEAIVDPSAQPGTDPGVTVTRPAVPQEQATAPPPRAAQAPEQPAKPSVDPTAIASARTAIQDTRPAGDPRDRRGAEVSDEHADRDDPDADDHTLGGAELLERELGARIIEEIKHD